jgi:peptidoglycan hydrolase-like protein with peptidoglycan-binding domain
MTNPYAYGTRSDDTLALQRALAGLGLYTDGVDGIFGPTTAAGVAAARLKFGLAGSGVDTALLRALGLAPAAAANPITDFVTQLLLKQAVSLFASQLKGLFPMNFLSGYKTYIVAAFMLLTGIAGLLGVDIPSFTGQAPGELVMDAFAFFFLRQGLKTGA